MARARGRPSAWWMRPGRRSACKRFFQIDGTLGRRWANAGQWHAILSVAED